MNVFTFTGNIGKDCELGSTTNGTKTCEFSVAVSSGYGDNKKTTWANCVIFGKRVEGQLPQYLTKGQKVAISGEATLETWDGGSKLKVVVSDLDLIGAMPQTQNSGHANGGQQQAPQQPAQNQVPQGFDNFDDDIPF